MAEPGLKKLLLERDPDTPESMPEDVRYLLDHLATAAALLDDAVDAYEGLLRRREAGESIGAEAADHAERIAAVMQSLGRRRDLAVAAQETPLNPTSALAVLDQASTRSACSRLRTTSPTPASTRARLLAGSTRSASTPGSAKSPARTDLEHPLGFGPNRTAI